MSAITVERSEGVCRIQLSRPEKLNALNREMVDALLEVQQSLIEDPEIHVVVLSGQGRGFSAGADLTYISQIYRDPIVARAFLNSLRDVIVNFERLEQPVIGAVHGFVLAGGLELMMGCDIVVAARSTRIGDQHMQRGFIPGGGNTQRIPWRISRVQALDLLLTGRWLTANDALSMGLISRVVDDHDLGTETERIALQLASTSYSALKEVKRLTHLAHATPIAEGLELEIDAVMRYYRDPAFVDALATFTERPR